MISCTEGLPLRDPKSNSGRRYPCVEAVVRRRGTRAASARRIRRDSMRETSLAAPARRIRGESMRESPDTAFPNSMRALAMGTSVMTACA